ncbi:cytochrome P450 [Colletotrichum asianum]|uniref:Cytochrome P450 n=1 Tax=Colletotrichum asianum TaxID=702518 RepID=A0A8H3W6X6_9PEZI|nr:cytochrome P450 [Colletotrichum asianum]
MSFLSPETMLSSQAFGTGLLILLLAWLVRKLVKVMQFKKRYRLPNPVPGLPLIGNAHQIPRDLPYLFFQDLAKKHGEMFTINIGGTNWLFLNSKRTVNELLEKRAAIYSSRMNLPMAYDLVSRGKRTLLMPYGDLWRRERKVMHQILNATQRNIFEPFQDLESKALLLNYLERPDEWWKSHGAFSGSVIMSVVFGRRAGVDDANLSDSLAVSEEFVEYLMPGRAIVDHFPFLADIPWFKSLQPWRWYGDDLYKRTRAVYKRELDQLRERRAQGKQRDCFMTEFLEKEHDSDFTEDEFLFMAGALMEAGTDTTRASLDQCVAAAALWPDWIERARKELDEVCGARAERLPTAQDMPNLPIIKGAVKESVRWKPTIAETGIPHALMRDDEFEGYKIPAGTIVTYNQWAIANSTDEYEQPERFWPERFINDDLDKPAKGHLGFGAGRRLCVGYNVAITNLHISLARLVYCFDILPVPDAKIDTSQSPKVTKHGPSFQVKIKVRTTTVVAEKAALELDIGQGSWADDSFLFNDFLTSFGAPDVFGIDLSMLSSLAPMLAPRSPMNLQKPPLLIESSDHSVVSEEATKVYDNTLGNWKPRHGASSRTESLFISVTEQASMVGQMRECDSSLTSHYLTAEKRDSIVYLVQKYSANPNTLAAATSFPSAAILGEVLQIFLSRQRDDIVGMIHLPTFNVAECDPLLLAAMISAGAAFPTHPLATEFGFALMDVVRMVLMDSGDRDNAITRSLSFIQAMTLVCECALWSGDQRKTEMSDATSAILASILRHSKRLFRVSYKSVTPPVDGDEQNLHLLWIEWANQESFKRAVHRFYLQCIQRSAFRNTPSPVPSHDMTVPPPHISKLWLAESAEKWSIAYSEVLNGGPEDQKGLSLSRCLSDVSVLKRLPPSFDFNFTVLMASCSVIPTLVEARTRYLATNIGCRTDWARGIADTWEITTTDLRTFNDVRYIVKSEPDASHTLASFYLAYIEFCASAPMPMVDALLGNENYWSSREAFEQLRSWAGTQQARRATWHSGQILRAVRRLSPKDRADFHGFVCYQAMLSLWVYSLYQTCPASMTDGEAEPAEDELRVQIDGEETIKSQRWISYGAPTISFQG